MGQNFSGDLYSTKVTVTVQTHCSTVEITADSDSHLDVYLPEMTIAKQKKGFWKTRATAQYSEWS
jgi:hypothetical protein